jgi:hypothetical protein
MAQAVRWRQKVSSKNKASPAGQTVPIVLNVMVIEREQPAKYYDVDLFRNDSSGTIGELRSSGRI